MTSSSNGGFRVVLDCIWNCAVSILERWIGKDKGPVSPAVVGSVFVFMGSVEERAGVFALPPAGPFGNLLNAMPRPHVVLHRPRRDAGRRV